MTKEELAKLVALQKQLTKELEDTVSYINSKDFDTLNGLNKDLFVVQANAMQALVGVLSIRIGLNISSAVATKPEEQTSESKEVEQDETAAQEENKPDEPVS